MKITVTCAVAALMLTGSGVAGAQNVVVNPEFDTDVSGWGLFGGTWSPVDWQGSPSSGSATRTLVTGGTSAPLADQCIDLAGELPLEYELSAQVYMPSGQPGTGAAYLDVSWFFSPDCISQISGESSPQVITEGVWFELADTFQPPEDAMSVHIAVNLWAQTGGGFQGYVDHVALTWSSIFDDDFESGTLGSWSAVAPGPGTQLSRRTRRTETPTSTSGSSIPRGRW